MADYETVDFRRPTRLLTDIQDRVNEWFGDFCSNLVGHLAGRIAFDLEVFLERTHITRPSELNEILSETSTGHRIGLSHAEQETILVLPTRLALVLVSGLFGEKPTTLPNIREFTKTEQTLYRFLMESIVGAISETQINVRPVETQLLQPVENLKRTAVLKPNETVLVATFTASGEFGKEQFHWVIPVALVNSLFGANQESDIRPTMEDRDALVELMGDLATRLTVRLGVAQLNSEQLRTLATGDLLILDQRVDQPLNAEVGGEDVFKVFPARIQQRQACHIHSHVNELSSMR